jgi:ABC-type polysaccharide/polyol phosphate transport system ATPase subunit
VSSLSDFDFDTDMDFDSSDDHHDEDSSRKLFKEKTDQMAISVSDLSLTYRTTFEKTPTLRSTLTRFGRGERVVHTIEALKNVSFEIPHGTVLGVVGHNGAGKSTLLRAISGIMPPTSGQIAVHGKVSTLLSLGVGFNTELSGTENIVLAGLAIGMSRAEVAEKHSQIVEFAELGDFIDMPTRTYSSGMSQRLAFSVAVHMNPDILLIDEALSAGDARFKLKAQDKMKELMESARTMVLVSHALSAIRDLCNDAIWLDHGQLMMHADPATVTDAYTDYMKVAKNASVVKEDL